MGPEDEVEWTFLKGAPLRLARPDRLRLTGQWETSGDPCLRSGEPLGSDRRDVWVPEVL